MARPVFADVALGLVLVLAPLVTLVLLARRRVFTTRQEVGSIDSGPGLVRLLRPQGFTMKHRWSLKNNVLSGIMLTAWLEILWRRRQDISFSTYWPRIIFLTVMACNNSLLSCIEWVCCGAEVRRATVDGLRPVFILGHPRTGTTHLHNLMSRDTERFTFPSTFMCGFPGSFLIMERLKFLFAGVLDATRPMDNMKLDFDLPQEDELATNVLSGGISYYQPITFMTNEPEYRSFASFADAAPEDRKRWQQAFRTFYAKMAARDQRVPGRRRRPLLKSPVHTGRIPLLLELFPDAQFIYIHRNPYDVFRSAANMADKTYWFSYLSVPTEEQIMTFVLEQYRMLWESYKEGRALLRPDQLIEVSYEELDRDPTATVERIYDHFGWAGFDSGDADGHVTAHRTPRQEIEAYVAGLGSFKKNKHPPMEDTARDAIYEMWGDSFRDLGYDRFST